MCILFFMFPALVLSTLFETLLPIDRPRKSKTYRKRTGHTFN